MASSGERHGGIEKGLGPCDHLVAAPLVVALARLAWVVRDDIGAVKGVVEASPPGIRRVQRVARVGQGHDKLRSADLADFLVDLCRFHLARRGLRQQITDLLEESGVGIHVERLAFVRPMPAIDFGLQRVANRQQFPVPGREIADDGCEPSPECVGRNPGFGGRFVSNEIEQNRGDLQTVSIDTLHDGLFSQGNRDRSAFQGNNRQCRLRRQSRPF